MLSFASNQVLLAQDEKDLEINFTKTEYAAAAAGSNKILDLEVSNKLKIQVTKQFKYSGFTDLNYGKTTDEMKNILGCTRDLIRQLNGVILNTHITNNITKTNFQRFS